MCIVKVVPCGTSLQKTSDQLSLEKTHLQQFICPGFVFSPDLRDHLSRSEAIVSPWKLHFYCLWQNTYLGDSIIQTKSRFFFSKINIKIAKNYGILSCWQTEKTLKCFKEMNSSNCFLLCLAALSTKGEQLEIILVINKCRNTLYFWIEQDDLVLTRKHCVLGSRRSSVQFLCERLFSKWNSPCCCDFPPRALVNPQLKTSIPVVTSNLCLQPFLLGAKVPSPQYRKDEPNQVFMFEYKSIYIKEATVASTLAQISVSNIWTCECNNPDVFKGFLWVFLFSFFSNCCHNCIIQLSVLSYP